MTIPRNILLLYAARGVRGFGDGFATITLPAYLIAIGYDPVRIGLVVAASLLGTAVLTLAVGAIASRYDLRALMLLGAVLMILTGLAFPNFRNIAIIAFIGFVGSINPSSGDLGVLVPLEQAMLASNVSDEERTRAFARYSLTGALLTALGTLAAAAPDFLQRAGFGAFAALTVMFYAYAALGVGCALLYWLLPHAHVTQTAPAAPLGPSRGIVYKLSALFSLDSFAGGFIVQSLLALWLFERFHLSLSAASVFFFGASLLSALSFPVAAWLSRRIGLVNTMVFTHVPSNLFLILAAFSSSLEGTLALLLMRSALSQMDVPTRTSYIMAVVTPAERAAAASVTAVPRSLASAISPTVAGALFAGPFSALPLLICGTLKLVYDAALLFSFRHLKAPEETAHRSNA
jgi:MFS family permease